MTRKPKQRPMHEESRKAGEMVLDCTALRPGFGIILGSGLEAVVAALEAPVDFPREGLAGMPPATAPGHSGRLVLGRVAGVAVAVFCGRTHLYEGFVFDATLAQVRLLAAVGVQSLLITNAAGGLAPGMRPGDWMLLDDHIDLTFTQFPTIKVDKMDDSVNKHTGCHPQTVFGGAGSTQKSPIYDATMTAHLHDAFFQLGARVHRGVYAGLTGPTYETPAEVVALRVVGADAVGMSTVHEAIEARRLGMRVVGLSCITNAAASETSIVTHDEVLSVGARAAASLAAALPVIAAFTQP